MPGPAVFLDRDGTLNVESDFLSDPADLRLESGVADGARALQDAGFTLVVITNQSGVARGYHTEEDVRRVHDALSRLLARDGVAIERFYHCPHHPDGVVPRYAVRCDCRKPAPGMLLTAARELDLDLSASYLVGDSARDLEAGRAVGVRTVLVRTGYGRQCEPDVRERSLADHIADGLPSAAAWILQDSRL